MAGTVGGRGHEPFHRGRTPLGRGPLLQPDDVSLSLRRGTSRGKHIRIHRGGCSRTLPPSGGPRRVRADRVRRLRDTLGELRPEGRDPSDGPDPPQRRDLHAAAAQDRGDVRLEPRRRHDDAGLLPLDPVDLSRALSCGSGRAGRGPRQLVPLVQDGVGQRAGDRRPLRALRHTGRPAPDRTVVLQDLTLRRAAAQEPGHTRLVGADEEGAAELDRPERGGDDPLPAPRPGPGGWSGRRGRAGCDRGLHDPARHDLRGHLHGPRPRTSAGRPGDDPGVRRSGGPLPRHRLADGSRCAEEDREGEDGRLHGRLLRESGDRHPDPGLDRRLCPDGVRDGSDHGRAGPRREGPRVRPRLRSPDPPRRRAEAGRPRRVP